MCSRLNVFAAQGARLLTVLVTEFKSHGGSPRRLTVELSGARARRRLRLALYPSRVRSSDLLGGEALARANNSPSVTLSGR
jgi:hypothetical protein